MRVLCVALAAWAAASLWAEERPIDPTFLRRHVPGLEAKPCGDGCRYEAIFGEGAPDAGIVKGIARYGGLILEPGGATAAAEVAGEERVYVILEGSAAVRYGKESVPVKRGDFFYIAAGAPHSLSNPSTARCRAIEMGFRIPPGVRVQVPETLPLANIDDVPKQTVAGHPPTTLYQLLMGGRESKRDKIAAAHVLTSLFIMEFAPGGTNFPHHHEEEEEIYLVLDGNGDMVAGGGLDGIEARFPAKAGDAYFFRLNCTVGFYSSNEPGSKARILAARSRFPFPKR